MAPSTSTHKHDGRHLKLSRIVPALTILGAGLAIVLALLQLIQLSLPESIIITLLGLLAIDALTERVSLLERIETKLGLIPGSQTLKLRAQIIGVETQAAQSQEICIVAISGVSLSYRYVDFFERKIRDGCKIKIVLLNPDNAAAQVWQVQSKIASVGPDIKSSLAAFKSLIQPPKAKGKCEIRLADVFPPFSMLAVDLDKTTASMNVEFHLYKRQIGERPHIFLTPSENPYWFTVYREQFEQIWADAKPWNP